MKKLIALILILSAALTMSGCFPTGEKDPNVSISLPENNTFEYEKENLKARFDIPTFPENIPMRIKLKEKYFDYETIEKIFLDGKILNPEESEGLIHWYTDGSHLEFLEELNQLSFSEGSLYYPGFSKHPEKTPINYYLYVKYAHECNREKFGIGKELESFSSQSAIDRALKLCSELGINGLGEPEVYAFDKNSYEKFRECKDFSDNWFNSDASFSNENDVYVLRFIQQFGGIKLASINDAEIDDSTAKYGKDHIYSPEVIVGVSKDCIFHFNAWETYEAEYEVVDAGPIKFGADYALNELKGYFEDMRFTKETMLDDFSVAYYPVRRNEPGCVEFAAAWCFKGLQHDGAYDFMFNHYNIFFLTDNGYRKDQKFTAN